MFWNIFNNIVSLVFIVVGILVIIYIRKDIKLRQEKECQCNCLVHKAVMDRLVDELQKKIDSGEIVLRSRLTEENLKKSQNDFNVDYF